MAYMDLLSMWDQGFRFKPKPDPVEARKEVTAVAEWLAEDEIGRLAREIRELDEEIGRIIARLARS